MVPVTVAVPSEAAVSVATLTVAPASTVPVIVWLFAFIGVVTAFIPTVGGVVSTVHVKLAGVGSVFADESVAFT